jgi:hypothetical protein
MFTYIALVINQNHSIMSRKKRTRILRFDGNGQDVSTDSKLRRLWEKHGRDTDVVRIHLMHLETKGIKTTDLFN